MTRWSGIFAALIALFACGRGSKKDEPMPSRERMAQLIHTAQWQAGAFQLACVNRDNGMVRILDAIPGADRCGGKRQSWLITLDSDNQRTRGRIGDCFHVGPVTRLTLTRKSPHWLLNPTDDCNSWWRFDDDGKHVPYDER